MQLEAQLDVFLSVANSSHVYFTSKDYSYYACSESISNSSTVTFDT